MAVKLLKQRDGQAWRPCWYGAFDMDGKRTVFSTKIRWVGTPPSSGSLRDKGDAAFERSREIAEDKLERFRDESRHKGNAAHLVERMIEAKTGRAVKHVRIAELADRWLSGPRKGRLSDKHAADTRTALERFARFMETHNRKAAFLYEVTQADAGVFVEALRCTLAPRTVRKHASLLQSAFGRCLPAGTANPFEGFAGRNTSDPDTIHRMPFTADELQSLIEAARGDDMMRDLVTSAACTGMRRGDLCRLRWKSVDLDAGMLAVKTSKTGATVEIPIFDPLRAVLESRKGNESEFVFPEAAAMLAENESGLTWRFKKIVALTLDTEPTEPTPDITPAAEIEAEGMAAIESHVSEGPRRNRMLEVFRRYCAGESFREIERAIHHPRATISADLRAVEAWTGTRFVRSLRGPNLKEAIARVTRVERKQGTNAASVRDWHALRTSFVSLALSAGVPMELVRRVTGHATVDVVLKHYFRPGREDFRAALVGALPDVLTGAKPAGKSLPPADELAALVAKVQSGTATAADKSRLRELAASV